MMYPNYCKEWCSDAWQLWEFSEFYSRCFRRAFDHSWKRKLRGISAVYLDKQEPKEWKANEAITSGGRQTPRSIFQRYRLLR